MSGESRGLKVGAVAGVADKFSPSKSWGKPLLYKIGALDMDHC